ncbi:MAG: argininosuccinate lyase [Armatimonadetes bacterium]|nr:argininosuccinate lyase [Armatimonadota bacterium]
MSAGRLWDKGGSLDAKILAFTVGSDPILDLRLVPFDIHASIAHVQMLGSCGHLAADEADALVKGLESVGADFKAGKWSIETSQEDCHTAIEYHLTERLGPLGGKVHLGRSRNDQVLTAIRLFLKAEIGAARGRLSALLEAFDRLIAAQGSIAIPGYTHTQQAMPSSVALWAGGFSGELASCAALLDAAWALADQSPLGSAAGYGTPGLTLDRAETARLLDFSKVQEPVTAAQLSRGKAESALGFALVQILGDLGRLAADICLFASQEFGFVRLDDDVSTGSSIMPQKRNPDVFELIRGHATQAQADLLALLGLTTGLSSGYHRDLQLMKEALFRLVDRGAAVMEIAAYALGRIHFDAARAAEITTPGIHAAERAFTLVQSEGISFREAYRRVAAEG